MFIINNCYLYVLTFVQKNTKFIFYTKIGYFMSEGEIVVILSPNATKYHHRKTEVDKAFKPLITHSRQHFIYSSVITGELVNHCSQPGGGLLYHNLLTVLGSILASPNFFLSFGYKWCKRVFCGGDWFGS